MSTGFINFYALLGVSPGAGIEDIRRAYHKKAADVHPDKRPDLKNDPRAQQLLRQLNEAWEILSDPAKRSVYDTFLRQYYDGRQLGASAEPPPPPPPPQAHRGIFDPLVPASFLRSVAPIVFLLVIAGVGAAAAFTVFRRPKSKDQLAADEAKAQAIEAERKLELEKARIAEEQAAQLREAETAKKRQASALAASKLKSIRASGDRVLLLVKSLDAELEKWDQDIRPIPQNERGKLLAASEADVRAMQALLATAVPSKLDAQAMHDRIRTLLQPVDEELAKKEPLFVPEDSLTDQLRSEAASVETSIQQIKTARDQVERMIMVAQQAGRKSPLSLQQAIDQLNAAELEAKNTALAATEKKSREELTAAEVRIAKEREEAKLRLAQDEAAALRQQGEAAVEHQRLLQKARSPQTKQLLAFFFVAGYLQPDKSLTTEKRPVSYAKLGASGALKSDEQGLNQLYNVLRNRADKERPLWPDNRYGYRSLTSNEKERLLQVQQLLIELGPVLVELKMLDP